MGKTIFADLPLFSHYRARNIKAFLVKSDTYVRDGIDAHLSKDVVFILALNARHVKMYGRDVLSFGVVLLSAHIKLNNWSHVLPLI